MQISLVVIKTKQLEAVRDFYEGLGLVFREEKHRNGPVHFSAAIKGAVFEVYPLPQSVETADTTTRLGFRIEKLDETIGIIEEAGGHVVTHPKQTEWGYFVLLKDPDGRSVELYQEEE